MVDKYKIIFTATIDTKELEKQTDKISKKKINIGAKQAQKDVKGLSQTIGEAIKKTVEWTVATGAVFGALQQLRQGVQYIKDLNKEMTDIRVVTGATKEETNALAKEFNSIAKEMGATTIEVAQGSLEWFRQGKTAEEAQQLIRASLVASKLANMESAQATEYLTSILNGFKLEAEDSTWVLDKLIAVDNLSATSMAELAEALKRSANSAQQAGVGFDTLTAYIATVSSVTRKSAGSIGESFKTLFARLQNLKLNKLDEMGTSVSDVEKVLDKFTNVTLFKANGQFRNMDEVILELSQEWDSLQNTEKSAIATAIAGVRQRENFLVLMENFNDVLEYQQIQADSAGQAMDRYQIYLESVEAHSNQLRASWEEMWAESTSGDTIIFFIDLARSVVELITKMGGLASVLETILGLIIIIKSQAIATAIVSSLVPALQAVITALMSMSALWATNVAGMGLFAGGIATLKAGVGGLSALLNPVVALIAGIAVLYVQIKNLIKLQEKLRAEAEEGYKYLEQQASKNFATNLEGIEDQEQRKEIIYKKTGDMVNYLSEQYDGLSDSQKKYISREEWVGSVIKASAKELRNNSDNLVQYRANLQKLADQFGYTLQVFEDSDDINFISSSGVVIDLEEFNKTLGEGEFDLDAYNNALKDINKTTEKTAENAKDLREIFNNLHSSMSGAIDIAQKSLEGTLTIDDISKLSKEYESWVDLLEIEGDIITLNTEKLQKLNVQKAYTAKFEAMMAGASEKELKFYDAYISQLERAIPMSRNYAQFLQDVALQASGLTGSLGGFSEAIGEISRQFEEGELSATQYFDALQAQIDEADFGSLKSEQQQLMFAGLVYDASSSLSQISSMFDAGEIDILGYSEQLMGVMGVFQQLGQVADASGIEVSGALGEMSNATMRLADIQKMNLEIAKVVQLQATENLRIGTQEFQTYAQNMAQLAIDAGIQVQDLQGNVFTSASQIAQWMSQSQENFNSFTTQTAGATGSAIGDVVHSAGLMLEELGGAISNFDAQIYFNPVPEGTVGLPAGIGGVVFENFLQVPKIRLDVSATSTSMSGLGDSLKALGQSLQESASNINLGNDIYNLTQPLNQITGAGGQVSDVYDDLEDAISGATDKTKELTDAVEEMRKKQLEALKEQLDSYNKIINKRKQLLETMSAERRYQDELEDRQKSIADLQKEILELSMDSSEEAKRRRQELEAQMSEQQKELDTFQFEHSVDQQQAMLEEERQRFEDQIAGAIKIIENIEADNVQEFINKLREALGYIPTEKSTPAPMSAIQSADAFISNQTLSSAMSGSSLTGSFSSIGDKLANLTLSGSPQITTREVNFSVEKLMEINVSGNLDESVLPDIEAISQQVIGKINEIMNLRGFARNAGSYSI